METVEPRSLKRSVPYHIWVGEHRSKEDRTQAAGQRSEKRRELGRFWRRNTTTTQKQTGRACHEKQVNTMVKPGHNKENLFHILNECRNILEGMGQTAHHERYKYVFSKLFLPNTKICNSVATSSGTSYNIQHMAHTVYDTY